MKMKYEMMEDVLGSGSWGEVREVRLRRFPNQHGAVKIAKHQHFVGLGRQ